MITLRSGKEVEKATSKNKVMINDEVVEVKANRRPNEVNVSNKNDVENAKKSKKDEVKENEPSIDIKALPFP